MTPRNNSNGHALGGDRIDQGQMARSLGLDDTDLQG